MRFRDLRHYVLIAASFVAIPRFAGAEQATVNAATARTEFLAAARLTPDAEHGAQLFETCAACHGITHQSII